MKRAVLYVAMRSNTDDTVTVHVSGGVNDYATLCGQSNDGDSASDEVVDVPKGAKIDCSACHLLFTIARRLRTTDFKRN